MEKPDGEMQVVEIDLTEKGNEKLDEFMSPSVMLGGKIELLLKMMFGGGSIPVNIKGNRRQVNSFTKALAGEKKYIRSAAKYGLDNPRTYKDKYKLRSAVNKFERATGLKWPFK